MNENTMTGSFAEQLLSARRTSASPWLTWYAVNGERIELSGRVFDNWVAKSANLLADLFDLEEGHIVVLDLPAHWKSLVLALAALHHGATLVEPTHASAAECAVWITDDPQNNLIPDSSEILAVNPAALALSFGADLGPVAEDFNASVRSFADRFVPFPVQGATPAIISTAEQTGISLAALFTQSAEPQGTILVPATVPVLTLLPYAVAQWAAGDAIVLVEEGVEVTERLREGERISHDYAPVSTEG